MLTDIASTLESEYKDDLTEKIDEARAILAPSGKSRAYAAAMVDKEDRATRVFSGEGREYAPDMRNIWESKRLTSTRQFYLDQLRRR